MNNGDYEDTEVFNFKDTGKLSKAEAGKKVLTWYSNGQYYVFNEDDVLQTEWYDIYIATPGLADYATEGIATGDGTQGGYAGDYPAAPGWVYSLDKDEDEYHWYYLVGIRNNDGTVRSVPFNFQALPNQAAYRALQVKGKTYLFNTEGEMQTGLADLRKGSDKQLPLERV